MSSNVALIDGYVFFLSAEDGEIPEQGGLFRRDTRFLSDLAVVWDESVFEPLSSEVVSPDEQTIRYADGFSSVNEISESGEDKRTAKVLQRRRTVSRDGTFREASTLTNHSSESVQETLTIRFDADFADLFEARGVDGGIDRDVTAAVEDGTVRYEYGFEASDGARVEYRTSVTFDPPPDTLAVGEARYDLDLAAQETTTVDVQVSTRVDDPASGEAVDGEVTSIPAIGSDRQGYARTFRQAKEDLEALTADSPHGPVLLAGAPWFATVFGRDSLLTAFQILPAAPNVAKGVLSYLAAHQSRSEDPASLSEPGKIFHEIRHGELARRGRIPYSPFFGTIDATALWIVLLDEYYRWTDDDEFVEGLQPSIDAALGWLTDAIEAIGDDPFLYYSSTDTDHITHTAWKDSDMSVQFADGTRATPPLASAEVQGYTFDALVRAAHLLRAVLDDADRAAAFEEQADELRAGFNEEFWLPEREFFAAAKTDDGRLADTVTSNVGQCLWSGIVDPKRADSVVDTLFSDGLYSGWGIRSMSASDAGYSPVSYHIGSVWPHDNSLIALGLARYGYVDQVERLATDLLDATCSWPDHQFPEVFCGFSDEAAPTRYPASCEPQAWGAGTPYALVRALLEVSPPGPGAPRLPSSRFGLDATTLELFDSDVEG